ncbi:hypothetical protein [Streptomyces hainanensis]|uniref:Uncharacterized protein n=1 Tax=Streptomyces hainanensis TaxID=402648 RepID=A0A4R4TH18_9ACTN|nr:hypothetical protein [Streptomyces hainanensis]TDC74253.1 hypothetical protein E1283_16290 [Streptomyces hainanensis]
MTNPGCPHPGELSTEGDGRHCQKCGALIYAAGAAAAIAQLPLPARTLVRDVVEACAELAEGSASGGAAGPLDVRLVIARSWRELDAEQHPVEDHAPLLALVLERAARHLRAATEPER